MKIYFDMCALKRPYDHPTGERVSLEATAVLSILSNVERGKVQLLSSGALQWENSRNPDPDRRGDVAAILDSVAEVVGLNQAVRQRAAELERMGFRPLDAIHAATAESGEADILVTCDDRFLRRASSVGEALRVRVMDPLEAAQLAVS